MTLNVRQDGTIRRGDNIPDVRAYAHYNEEAQAIWYAENRYDMEHPDEVIGYDEERHYSDDYDVDEA